MSKDEAEEKFKVIQNAADHLLAKFDEENEEEASQSGSYDDDFEPESDDESLPDWYYDRYNMFPDFPDFDEMYDKEFNNRGEESAADYRDLYDDDENEDDMPEGYERVECVIS